MEMEMEMEMEKVRIRQQVLLGHLRSFPRSSNDLVAVVQKTGIRPDEVGDIVVGTVLPPGSQRAMECRMAAFYAGFPETVPVKTVNRQCSSGLQAVADVAAAIKSGFYDIGIGAGLELMSVNSIGSGGLKNPRAQTNQKVQDCLLPMGITSENVAGRYGISREDQDEAAVRSHKNAAAAAATGRFKDEIIPVHTKAFASQYVYCCQKLELDPEKVNVNGGAIALGHPLGATGARCVGTLLHEMKRRGKDCRFGVVSMCIGSGMGAAAVFERGSVVDQMTNARPINMNNLLSKDVQ